jgi:hypothetical protein
MRTTWPARHSGGSCLMALAVWFKVPDSGQSEASGLGVAGRPAGWPSCLAPRFHAHVAAGEAVGHHAFVAIT